MGNRVSSVGETRILWLTGGDAPVGANLGFPNNKVVTSKYTLWNFLPKNLFEQFRRIANFYFLCMSVVALTIDSPVSPVTSVAPLVFVILVTMVKQGYEDFLRHRADREVNNTLVTVVRNGCPQNVKSEKVRVGDLLVVRREEDMPCDMVLMASSDPDGRAHVTTANLDGETNLKLLLCPRLLRYFSTPEQLSRLRAQIECEHPNADLYRFYGKIEIFPTDDNLYASLLADDPDAPGGLSPAEPPAPEFVRLSSARPSRSSLNLPKVASDSALSRGPSAADAGDGLVSFRDPHSPSACFRRHTFINEESAMWASPRMNFDEAANKGDEMARRYSGLTPPYYRHSLAFGETVTNGRRSLKRVGLLMTPAEGSSSIASGVPRGMSVAGSSVGPVPASRTRSSLGRRQSREPGPGDRGRSLTDPPPAPPAPVRESASRASSASMRSVRLSRVSAGGAVPVRRLSIGLSAPLGTENLLLRGTRLRNTDYIFGCAVYTGPETKLALNSKLTSNKFSTVEKSVNKYLVFFLMLLLFEVGLSLALKYAHEIHYGDGIQYYLGKVFSTAPTNVMTDLLSFFILYNYIIPISLYVTIELQKFLGTFFFEWDMHLFDLETMQAAICNTSDLNEELGQVEVLFTDKTGTLTENLMVFRRCSVGGKPYAELDGKLTLLGPDMVEENGQTVPTFTSDVEEFFLALALCHTLQVDAGSRKSNDVGTATQINGTNAANIANGTNITGSAANNNNHLAQDEMPSYQAASPDEKALAEAAARLGIIFLGEEGDFLSVKVKGVIRRWRKLDVLEFTSDRKRMSTVVEDESGRTFLYCKGAETAVLPLVDSGPQHETLEHLNDFAMRGLRTLVVGVRELAPGELLALGSEVELARQTVTARRESLVAAAYELMERGLKLLGATAVEDRLQDGVQETLESLRAAGISVWILTGDKVETAVNISFSCGHFKNGTEQLYLTEHRDARECRVALERFSERVKADEHRQYGMVVDGPSLALALPHADLLREVCLACYAVVCCRMSPLQKCEVVQLVKLGKTKPVTAAIGDGANDVSMIQEAHVGIGVMGREGRQAVRCSDFAFARFKFLRRALLVHGHWYYERLATLVQYFFYKNVVFITPQLYYAFFSFYSAQALYDSLFLTLYNVLFTSLPILLYGLLEQTFKANTLLTFPHLYRRISRNALLSWPRFTEWILFGLWHSLVLFLLPVFLLYNNSLFHYNGQPLEYQDLGTVIFHNVVVVANLKLLLHSRHWTHFFVGSIVISIVGFMAIGVLYCSIVYSFFGPNMYLVYNYIMMSPVFWLLSLVSVITCLTPDLVLMVLWNYPVRRNIKKACKKVRDRLRGRRKKGQLNISTESSVTG